jgi:hypothetical protein
VKKKEVEQKIDIREKIAREVGKAIGVRERGSARVKVTFKREAIDALDNLCKLEREGAVMMSDPCAAVLSAARRRRYWGNTANRIITIGLGYNFNQAEFIKGLAKAIEDIQAVEKAKKG